MDSPENNRTISHFFSGKGSALGSPARKVTFGDGSTRSSGKEGFSLVIPVTDCATSPRATVPHPLPHPRSRIDLPSAISEVKKYSLTYAVPSPASHDFSEKSINSRLLVGSGIIPHVIIGTNNKILIESSNLVLSLVLYDQNLPFLG